MQNQNYSMKRTGMARLASLVLICCLGAFAVQAQPSASQSKPRTNFSHLNPQPDSVVVSLLGDEVSNIVFGAKKATLTHLNPMEPPADGDATIGGVKVVKVLGTLNKTDLNVVQFMMADSAFYNNGFVTVTSPYVPNYALSFVKGKQRVDLVFSLASFEVGIVVNGKLIKVMHYNNARQITRFFRIVSQNVFYDKIIEIQ